MIKALIFDLDGTLVQTEVLKARSYADAAVQLDPSLKAEEVIEGFKEFVGLSRTEVALGLLRLFDLEDAAAEKMGQYNVSEPWQAFVDIRLDYYNKLISDPAVMKEHACTYNIGLLKWAREQGYITGLGTMSHDKEAYKILDMLGIRKEFKYIATIQDVEHGKPDPAIYNLIAGKLGVHNADSLAVEDSSSGVKAALAAYMNCLAVTTDFTRQGVHELPPSDSLRIVDSEPDVLETAREFIADIDSGKEKII